LRTSFSHTVTEKLSRVSLCVFRAPLSVGFSPNLRRSSRQYQLGGGRWWYTSATSHLGRDCVSDGKEASLGVGFGTRTCDARLQMVAYSGTCCEAVHELCPKSHGAMSTMLRFCAKERCAGVDPCALVVQVLLPTLADQVRLLQTA
jgi:hypothetical protein